MDNKEMQLREQICDVCHKMWQLGWVAANDGTYPRNWRMARFWRPLQG